MRALYLLLMTFLLTTIVMAAPPTDNAVASNYSGVEGYPQWTNAVKWANVIDMSTYANGKTNFEKFE
ncbi:MAG: hypothetical protein WCJ56_14325, partial [bacterium]